MKIRNLQEQWPNANRVTRNDFYSHPHIMFLIGEPHKDICNLHGYEYEQITIQNIMVPEKWSRSLDANLSAKLFIGPIFRDHSGSGFRQWEKALHSNASSRWRSPYPQWSLILLKSTHCIQIYNGIQHISDTLGFYQPLSSKNYACFVHLLKIK